MREALFRAILSLKRAPSPYEPPMRLAILLEDGWALFGLACLIATLIVSMFVWLLGIEPFVRRRLRKSAFFLLPWAQWKDYRDGLKIIANKRRAVPWFFRLYQALLLIEGGCLILLIARWLARSF